MWLMMPRISKPYVERRLRNGTVVKEKTVQGDWTHTEYWQNGGIRIYRGGSGNYNIERLIGVGTWQIVIPGITSWHEAKRIAERLIEESER